MGAKTALGPRRVALALAAISIISTVIIGRLEVGSHMPFAPDPDHFSSLVTLADPLPSWRGIHLLAAGCPCSRNVAQHLATRGAVEGLHESAVLVGHDQAIEKLLKSRQMPLHVITPSESSYRYHIEGAPWFVLIAPDNSVAYAGGYAVDRNARDGYHEIAIWRTRVSGSTYNPLPVYGCAIGKRATRALDPLGLFTLQSERSSND